ELLVDHGHAGATGLQRIARRVGPAVQGHGPGVGGEGAGQDGHERALARAVLPDEGDDLPRRDLEVHAVEGRRGRERLGDAPHLQARRGSGGYGFSHCERSGWSTSFISGLSMFSFVARRTPVSMRLSTGCPLMCATRVLTPR